MALADHRPEYGKDAALLTSPAHRGVVQRRTSPGRSEVVGARGLRRGSRGHTPIPKPWGDMQVTTVLSWAAARADGPKYLSAQQGAEELRSTDKKTWLGRDRPKWHGTSGRYVCLCGRFRCFFASFGYGTRTQASQADWSLVCALFFCCSVLNCSCIFWTYRIISRVSLGHRPRT